MPGTGVAPAPLVQLDQRVAPSRGARRARAAAPPTTSQPQHALVVRERPREVGAPGAARADLGRVRAAGTPGAARPYGRGVCDAIPGPSPRYAESGRRDAPQLALLRVPALKGGPMKPTLDAPGFAARRRRRGACRRGVAGPRGAGVGAVPARRAISRRARFLPSGEPLPVVGLGTYLNFDVAPGSAGLPALPARPGGPVRRRRHCD